MIKIYSNLDPKKLLHIVVDSNKVEETINLISEENFLQCMIVKKDNGYKFKTHHHKYKPINFTESIAQETWFVYRGKIKVYHYDIDNSFISSHELSEGQMNITLFGGHTFEILEENTIVIENKNGPYYGQELDKVFFN